MSSLGEQLAKRRSQQGAAGFRPLHVRPSLLFDHKQAATIELAHIHLLALSGLEQLQKLEPRVKPFEQTLFAPASVVRIPNYLYYLTHNEKLKYLLFRIYLSGN